MSVGLPWSITFVLGLTTNVLTDKLLHLAPAFAQCGASNRRDPPLTEDKVPLVNIDDCVYQQGIHLNETHKFLSEGKTMEIYLTVALGFTCCWFDLDPDQMTWLWSTNWLCFLPTEPALIRVDTQFLEGVVTLVT